MSARRLARFAVLGVPFAIIAAIGACSPGGGGSGGSGFSGGDVYALTAFDEGDGPRLFAGGTFLFAGGVSASRIAMWDGLGWSPLGAGLDAKVLALVVHDDGASGGPALFAAGEFMSAGGIAASRVARWDGSQWSPVGSGLSGTVRALVTYDDGTGTGPALFAAGDFPLSVAVAIDRSFSMGERVAVAKSAARAFVGALRPDDQVMVLAVGSGTETVAPLSTDHQAALEAVDRLDRWGTTPLYDATIAAIDAIEPAQGRRALILVSDGTDRYSTATAADLLEHTRHANVLVYPIAIGQSRPLVFAELAAASGGRYTRRDVRWHLPAVQVPAAPQVGATITDGQGRIWTIQQVDHVLFGRRDKLLDSEGVVTKADVDRGPDSSAEVGVKGWVDRDLLRVGELELEGRHSPFNETHRLTNEQIEELGGIIEDRNAEVTQ